MIGERVRLAREASRLTQQELAVASGIPLGTLGDIEAGQIINPSGETIDRIAHATTYPIEFFHLGPLPDLPEGNYRRLKRGKSKVTKQIRAQVRQVVELVQRAEGDGSLRLPNVLLEPITSLDRMDKIETLTVHIREMLGVGDRDPIPNLTRAVERAGVVVVALPTEMEDHSGFSVWPDFGLGGRPVIALSRGHSGDRDRFTIAHELGHLILHTYRANVEPGDYEAEANRFAGALLMSHWAAVEVLRPPVTLKTLKAAKATFGISMGAGAQRALDLEIISKTQFTSLRKQLSARGWNRNEPIEVGKEKPLLIAKVLTALAGEGPLSEQARKVSMPIFNYRVLASA